MENKVPAPTAKPHQGEIKSLTRVGLLAVLMVLCPFTLLRAADAYIASTVASCTNAVNGPTPCTIPPQSFNYPQSVAVNNIGSAPTVMYAADTQNNWITATVLATGSTTVLAGSGVRGWADGTGTSARFNGPVAVAVDSANAFLYVAEGANGTIRKVNLSTLAVTTVIGNSCSSTGDPYGSGSVGGCLGTYQTGQGTAASLEGPRYMVLSYAAPASSSSGALWVTDSAGRISTVDLNSSPATLYEMSSGFDARGIAGGNSGNFYVATGNFYDSNNRGRQILNCVPGSSLSSSVSCSVIAGTGDYWEGIYGDQFGYWNDEATGQPLTADFINPRGLAFDATNNRLFVADGNAIRVITFVNGAAANVITVAGGATKSTLHPWYEALSGRLNPANEGHFKTGQ